MERHGWSKYENQIFDGDSNPEAIKGGDCVVWFQSGGKDKHAVYVEYYDESTNTVYFSEGNMDHPDGEIQALSFDDFQHYQGWNYARAETYPA